MEKSSGWKGVGKGLGQGPVGDWAEKCRGNAVGREEGRSLGTKWGEGAILGL